MYLGPQYKDKKRNANASRNETQPNFYMTEMAVRNTNSPLQKKYGYMSPSAASMMSSSNRLNEGNSKFPITT